MKYLDNELHLIFNFIDRDCDGLISTNDFKQVIQELLPHTNQHGSSIFAIILVAKYGYIDVEDKWMLVTLCW